MIDSYIDCGQGLVDDLERFYPEEMLANLIHGALIRARRIDSDNVVLPIVTERFEVRRDRSRQRISDLIMEGPLVDYDTTQKTKRRLLRADLESRKSCMNVGSAAYPAAVKLNLRSAARPENEEEAFRKSREHLKEVASTHGYSIHEDGWQIDALHLLSTRSSPNDIAETRVYLNGGDRSCDIVRSVIENGSEFDSVKIWTYGDREDTPIFSVSSVAQLGSLVSILRDMETTEKSEPEEGPLTGWRIGGISNAYLGQCLPGTSFNFLVCNSLLSGPINSACENSSLRTGDHVERQGLLDLARAARVLAYDSAGKHGVSQFSHALVKDQPEEAIVAALT